MKFFHSIVCLWSDMLEVKPSILQKTFKSMMPLISNQCIIFKTVIAIKALLLSSAVELLSLFNLKKRILYVQLSLYLFILSIVQFIGFQLLNFVFKMLDKCILMCIMTLGIGRRPSLRNTMFQMTLSVCLSFLNREDHS